MTTEFKLVMTARPLRSLPSVLLILMVPVPAKHARSSIGQRLTLPGPLASASNNIREPKRVAKGGRGVNAPAFPLFTNVVEEEFCELRQLGILRS